MMWVVSLRVNKNIMSNYELFRGLHEPGNPFLLGNSWNVYSAKLFEKNGFKAIGTSSAAIANSVGYDDGEMIPFTELLFIVGRILSQIQVPLSVDMETGYGSDVTTVIKNIEKFQAIGVAGINLEDSEKRHQLPSAVFSKKLDAIKSHLDKNNLPIFINVRTDAFLFGVSSALTVTLERIRDYENAGADGIFVPLVSDVTDIMNITTSTALPVNVLSVPALPSFETLAGLGVARVSLGSSAFRATYGHFETLIKTVVDEKSVKALY
jgi:2-methylisocitrate lyase-like PEP mutase family enzyme